MSYEDKNKKFTVHISEENYEAEIVNDRETGLRPAGGRSAPPARREYDRERALRQRSDVPVPRTRVVTTREGDKYEIPDDTVLSVSKMKGSTRNKKGRGCIISVVYAMIIVSVSALLSYYMIVGINDMFGLVKPNTEIVVDIPENASLSEVTKILSENGVVNYPFFFKMYAQFSNDDDFQSGTFTLNSKSDYSALITKLTLPAGTVDGVIRVTIPEGLTVQEVAVLFEKNCICTQEAFYETLQNYPFKHRFMPTVPSLESKPNRIYRLEGYLYPATYDFYVWEGSKWGMNRLLNAFQENVMDNTKLDIEGAAQVLGVTVDDIITIASIIERESPDPTERSTVASVFYNRLKHPNKEGIGGRLQSDATAWYPYPTRNAMLKSETLSQSEKDNFVSAYNTSNNAGLPPGPICSPSLDAITAAAHPASTDYYFFFIDDNGIHHYGKTFADHEANIANARANGSYAG